MRTLREGFCPNPGHPVVSHTGGEGGSESGGYVRRRQSTATENNHRLSSARRKENGCFWFFTSLPHHVMSALSHFKVPPCPQNLPHAHEYLPELNLLHLLQLIGKRDCKLHSEIAVLVRLRLVAVRPTLRHALAWDRNEVIVGDDTACTLMLRECPDRPRNAAVSIPKKTSTNASDTNAWTS